MTTSAPYEGGERRSAVSFQAPIAARGTPARTAGSAAAFGCRWSVSAAESGHRAGPGPPSAVTDAPNEVKLPSRSPATLASTPAFVQETVAVAAPEGGRKSKGLLHLDLPFTGCGPALPGTHRGRSARGTRAPKADDSSRSRGFPTAARGAEFDEALSPDEGVGRSVPEASGITTSRPAVARACPGGSPGPCRIRVGGATLAAWPARSPQRPSWRRGRARAEQSRGPGRTP